MPSVILTRPLEENQRVAPCFEALGFAVHSVPLIELRPLAKDMCGLRSVRRLAGGEVVLLTSAYAADLWLDLRESDFREHAPLGYVVVGDVSAKLLREADPGVPIRALADYGEELLHCQSLKGIERMLYPCSMERRDALVDALRARGIDIVELPLYAPVLPEGSRELLPQALAGAEQPVTIAFFSPSAVRNFFSILPEIPRNAIFAAIGRTTAHALHERGVVDVIIPDRPSSEALAHALAGTGDCAA